MTKIDQSRMAERPAGVSENTWRAKLAYEAVQAEQAKAPEVHAVRTDSDARDAADAVRRGEEPPKARKGR